MSKPTITDHIRSTKKKHKKSNRFSEHKKGTFFKPIMEDMFSGFDIPPGE